MRSLIVSKSVEKKIKVFVKKYPTLRLKVEQTITHLLKNPFLGGLGTHKLTGRLNELYASNINYEYRIVFFFDERNLYVVNIGSHDEVY